MKNGSGPATEVPKSRFGHSVRTLRYLKAGDGVGEAGWPQCNERAI